MNGKYIIFERYGIEYPALIPDGAIGHNEVHMNNHIDTPIRAGFFCVNMVDITDNHARLEVRVWGESVSLRLKSHIDDADLIAKMFDV